MYRNVNKCYDDELDVKIWENEEQTFKVNGNKGSRHGRITGKKKGAAFFDDTSETVANGIDTQIWTVISHSYHNSGFLIFR